MTLSVMKNAAGRVKIVQSGLKVLVPVLRKKNTGKVLAVGMMQVDSMRVVLFAAGPGNRQFTVKCILIRRIGQLRVRGLAVVLGIQIQLGNEQVSRQSMVKNGIAFLFIRIIH